MFSFKKFDNTEFKPASNFIDINDKDQLKRLKDILEFVI